VLEGDHGVALALGIQVGVGPPPAGGVGQTTMVAVPYPGFHAVGVASAIQVGVALPELTDVAMAVPVNGVAVAPLGSRGVLLAWAVAVAFFSAASWLAVGSGLMLKYPQVINPSSRHSSAAPAMD
jgi:hypothetical protein